LLQRSKINTKHAWASYSPWAACVPDVLCNPARWVCWSVTNEANRFSYSLQCPCLPSQWLRCITPFHNFTWLFKTRSPLFGFPIMSYCGTQPDKSDYCKSILMNSNLLYIELQHFQKLGKAAKV